MSFRAAGWIVALLFALTAGTASIVAWMQRAERLRLEEAEAARIRLEWRVDAVRAELRRAPPTAAVVESISALRALHPDKRELFLLEGEAFERRNDFAAAVRAYDEAGDSPALLRRGFLRLRLLMQRALLDAREIQNQAALRDATIADLNASLPQIPDPGRKRIAEAGVRVCLGDFAAAIPILDSAIADDPSSVLALLVRGALRFRERDDAAALSDFETAIRLDPHLPEPLAYRGLLLFHVDRKPEAIESLGRSLDAFPGFFEARYLRGILLHETGHPIEAAADFRECLRQQPDHVESARRETEAALDAFARGGRKDAPLLAVVVDSITGFVTARPTDASAWLLRARLHEARGALDAAEADATAALTFGPDVRAAWVLRGDLRSRRGDAKGAVADFDEAIRRSEGEDRKIVRHRRALALARAGSASNSLAEFEALVREFPSDVGLALDRLRTLAASGQSGRALKESDALLEASASKYEIRLVRAAICFDQKEYARAVDEATAAADGEGDPVPIFLLRARAFAASGNKIAARQDLALALEKFPERGDEIEAVRRTVD